MAGTGGGKRSGDPRKTRPSVIVRREEIIEGGHHGGAWKVAYADFVTAMMAFFLLMWLLNATTDQQRRGIAAYFSPMAEVEHGFSNAGMVPGGTSPVADAAQLVDQGPMQLATLSAHGDSSKTENDGEPDSGTADAPQSSSIAAAAPAASAAAASAQADPSADRAPHDAADDAADGAARAAAEEKAMHDAAQRLREAVAHDPELAGVGGQMAIDVTPEGLRIQIMDAEHQPMFDSGSTAPTPRAQGLLRMAAQFIKAMPEPVSIDGYTDAAPYRTGHPSNWSLSSGRADAARDVLGAAGLADSRLSNVTGYADRKLLLPADPLAAANRRVVLTLHRAWPQPPVAQTR